MLRVVWTNGVPQNALDPTVRTVVREVQQLKGSCPFLYAFDGDALALRDRRARPGAGGPPLRRRPPGRRPTRASGWSSRANGSAPATGELTLDFTEELWETAYFDLAELCAVDHPAGVELVANEKMVPPPFPEKKLFTVSRPRDAEGRGRDAAATARPRSRREDGVFLAGFAPTRYQGIVAPHELVLELPEARGGRTVMLYLTGWILYADTSINVSLSQRRDLAAVGAGPRGAGRPRAAGRRPSPPMGYPAGKTKTMPVDLSGVLDRVGPARAHPDEPRDLLGPDRPTRWTRRRRRCVSRRRRSSRRELFFRGFSRMTRELGDGPQVFVHDDVSTRAPLGRHGRASTRASGDVRALLTAADDRYVVMKGGDAVRLTFDASGLPPLPEGWVRD